jgi:hypothetical protein
MKANSQLWWEIYILIQKDQTSIKDNVNVSFEDDEA